MCGLSLLKPWARRLAVGASSLMMAATLSFAALLIARAHPVAGLMATLSAGVHVLIIRYLRRPMIKTLFAPEWSNAGAES